MRTQGRVSNILFAVSFSLIIILSCSDKYSPTEPSGNNDSQNGTITGRITYEGGTDFSGITVKLEKVSGGETGQIIAAKAVVAAGEGVGKIAIASSDAMTTATDKDGNYEFTDVEPGEYSLTAQNTADHLAKVSKISVAAEGLTVVDVVLTATANIVGTVILEGLDDNSGVLLYLSGTSYMAMTDSEGSYTIFDVPLGTYELVTQAFDYQVAKAGVTLNTAAETAAVEVITLAKYGRIMGRVVDAVSGNVLDNVTVTTLSGETATSNSNGVFSIEQVPAGSALLSYTLSGYDIRWLGVDTVGSGELSTVPAAVKLFAEGTTPSQTIVGIWNRHGNVSLDDNLAIRENGTYTKYGTHGTYTLFENTISLKYSSPTENIYEYLLSDSGDRLSLKSVGSTSYLDYVRVTD